MAEYNWPPLEKRNLIGKRISRVDGPQKVSGKAKYTYDVKRPDMLYGKILRSPYAHAKIVSIDVSAAEEMQGVKAIQIIQGLGKEIQWAGDEVVGVAAVDETTAEDAIRAIKVQYERLPHLVLDQPEPPKDLPPSSGPLSMDDLMDLFRNQLPDEQIVAQIRERGLSFQPNDEFVQRLKRGQVPRERPPAENVIQAVQSATVKKESGQRSRFERTAALIQGDPDGGFKQAEIISEGLYGTPVITHCCLETHGAISEWTDDKNLLVHLSTQNLSAIPNQMATPLEMPAGNIRVHQDHIGGGFGSKFSPDRWSIVSAQLSKKAGGKPVKIMLERDSELKVAGCRPSSYARVKVGAKKDGSIVAWESQSWGTGGMGGGGSPPLPYVFDIPNQRKQNTRVLNNIGSARAWRAPNHPQACLITMSALDDTAAKLNMDPMDFFLKNIDMTGPRANIYRDEFPIAAELIGWKQNWHPRGDKTAGPVKRGLGLSLHTWGGRGHASDCDLTIHPDGSAEIKMGTQDLGTGTRTCILMVAADTLGIPMETINLMIGDTTYPVSGGSGGSTTIGGVSSSTRRAALDALDLLFAKVAPPLNTTPDQLEAVGGTVRVKGDASRSLPWKQACAKIGAVPLTAR
ncbi:MAG TPA: xanthine dehydrogenase family protein, partial [Candidatus Angelobacter sp.]